MVLLGELLQKIKVKQLSWKGAVLRLIIKVRHFVISLLIVGMYFLYLASLCNNKALSHISRTGTFNKGYVFNNRRLEKEKACFGRLSRGIEEEFFSRYLTL